MNLFPFTTFTFRTATKAAAAGGVTSLVDMPLNSLPPTTTTENLRVKAEAAIGQCWVNVKFWGGVIPGQTPPALLCSLIGFSKLQKVKKYIKRNQF